MRVVLDIARGVACLGEETIAVAAADDRFPGALRVAGGRVLRPLSFGERFHAVRRAGSVASPVDAVCAAVLAAATLEDEATPDGSRRDWHEVLALVLAGADEEGPGFTTALLALGAHTRWTPEEIERAGAAFVDSLARRVAPPEPDDGWTRFLFEGTGAADLASARRILAGNLLARMDESPLPAAPPQAAGDPAAVRGGPRRAQPPLPEPLPPGTPRGAPAGAPGGTPPTPRAAALPPAGRFQPGGSDERGDRVRSQESPAASGPVRASGVLRARVLGAGPYRPAPRGGERPGAPPEGRVPSHPGPRKPDGEDRMSPERRAPGRAARGEAEQPGGPRPLSPGVPAPGDGWPGPPGETEEGGGGDESPWTVPGAYADLSPASAFRRRSPLGGAGEAGEGGGIEEADRSGPAHDLADALARLLHDEADLRGLDR